ncbi:glycoside hydrolase N-terminal domain-containing protein [Nonomuraea wenchangensis]|uniref:glycoside hydrolase N-terminal domain-containing protein n=1 Tax=Nonomuraea wenchangensis TaxID=568860 RepID=UPI0033CF6FA7
MTFWYDQPATDWETQALPIGNGPMDAMAAASTTSRAARPARVGAACTISNEAAPSRQWRKPSRNAPTISL